MRVESLKEAIKEAERFLKLARKVEVSTVHGTHQMAGKKWQEISYPSPQNSACKRASLDLTRALAEMRKPI